MQAHAGMQCMMNLRPRWLSDYSVYKQGENILNDTVRCHTSRCADSYEFNSAISVK